MCTLNSKYRIKRPNETALRGTLKLDTPALSERCLGVEPLSTGTPRCCSGRATRKPASATSLAQRVWGQPRHPATFGNRLWPCACTLRWQLSTAHVVPRAVVRPGDRRNGLKTPRRTVRGTHRVTSELPVLHAISGIQSSAPRPIQRGAGGKSRPVVLRCGSGRLRCAESFVDISLSKLTPYT
jgi:hypothetical protein